LASIFSLKGKEVGSDIEKSPLNNK